MNAKEIAALVAAAAAPFAEQAGCTIWDVKFVREAGEWVLRVLIDTEPPGGVTIDMCEQVNRALDAYLDEVDPIEQSYCLEVSSPGINRELYRDGDFDKFAGSMVDIKLYKPDASGRKSFTARLLRREGETLIVEENGAETSRARSDIAQCRVHFDF